MPEKLDIETREELFRLSVTCYESQYDKKELDCFADYWTEPNKSKTKMKWELETTWDLGRRIKRWFNNKTEWNKSKFITNGITKDNHGAKNNGAYELLDSIKKDFGINT